MTVTKTKAEKVETSKVVCKTYPSYYYTSKEFPYTYTQSSPSSYVESAAYTKVKDYPSTVVTSKPYAETYQSKSESVYTTYYTETKEKCYPSEACTTKTKWGGGGW